MLVKKEIDEYNIIDELWSGALTTIKLLDFDEIKTILDYLDMGEPLTLTELNDFFWFEDDEIANILGYADGEALFTDREDRLSK